MKKRTGNPAFKIVAGIVAAGLAAFILISVVKVLLGVLILGALIKSVGRKIRAGKQQEAMGLGTTENAWPLAAPAFAPAMPLQRNASYSSIIPIA